MKKEEDLGEEQGPQEADLMMETQRGSEITWIPAWRAALDRTITLEREVGTKGRTELEKVRAGKTAEIKMLERQKVGIETVPVEMEP